MTYTIPPGVTSTSAELNYVDLASGAGTAEASKAMVLDASGDITSATQMTIANTSGATNAIKLSTNGGTSETIQFSVIQRVGTNAIELYAGAGGITLTHGADDAITLGASSSSVTHTAAADDLHDVRGNLFDVFSSPVPI